MKLLAIEREIPGIASRDFKPYLQAEAKRVWELYLAGIVREVYFRQDQPAAVLMLECADKQEAEKVLKTLPLVQARLIEFDILPLVPYPGFARLFGGL